MGASGNRGAGRVFNRAAVLIGELRVHGRGSVIVGNGTESPAILGLVPTSTSGLGQGEYEESKEAHGASHQVGLLLIKEPH